MTSPSKRAPARGRLSRRGLLKAGAVGAVGVGLGPALMTSGARAGLDIYFDKYRFLLDHAGQGFNLIEYQQAKAMGYDNWVEWQLDFESIDDSVLEDWLATEFPSIHMTIPQLFVNFVRPNEQYRAMLDMQTATTLRSLYSPRQLHERMCEFWMDHFNINQGSVAQNYNVFMREVIREHALGKFPDMLEASAQDGAMLQYLTNDTNVVGHAQENYARELMELHSLGVNGPYTETDVEELAKVFTGWTIYSSQFFVGEFTFFPNLHDYSTKNVLGYTVPGTGKGEGLSMLRRLGRHRSTSEYIAEKMCKWLLHYQPTAALVRQVARTYRQTDGDIKQMVRQILDLDNVTKQDLSKPKLKRPYQLLTSLCRATYADVEEDPTYGLKRGDALSWSLAAMGQQLFTYPSPDGFPDEEQAWGRAALPRWQFAQQLLDGWIYKVVPNLGKCATLVGNFEQQKLAQQISLLLTAGLMPDVEVDEIQDYVNQRPFSLQTIREAFALAGSSPSFQYY